jgi:hypothetical protein
MKILLILIAAVVVLTLVGRFLIARLDQVEQQFLDDESRENE